MLMRLLTGLLLLLLSLNGYGQAVLEDFKAGNRANAGNANLPVWSVTHPFERPLTFNTSVGYMTAGVDNTAQPNITITNITNPGGTNAVWMHAHAAPSTTEIGNSNFGLHITGSNPSGYNGYWHATTYEANISGASNTSPINITLSGAMTTTLSTGDQVRITNAAFNTYLNGTWTITVTDQTHFSLNGTNCVALGCTAYASAAVAVDNERINEFESGFIGGYVANSGTGTVIGILFQPFFNPYPYNPYPTQYLAGWLRSGSWNANYNRFKFELQCDQAWTWIRPASAGGISLGVYVKGTADGTSYQGVHWYNNFTPNIYQNRPMHMQANRMPSHNNNFDGNNVWEEDPLQWSAFQPTTPGQRSHYFDGMVEFYYQIYEANSFMAASPTCRYSNLRFDPVASGEVERYVASVGVTYNGTAYELSWSSPKNTAVASTYEVRHSTTASCHTVGFSNCTLDGTATGFTASPYQDVTLTTSSMPEISSGSIWFAIKPTRYDIKSVTGSGISPIIVTPTVGFDGQTGDSITVSNVTVNTNANGSFTVTSVPSQHFDKASGSLTNIVISGTTATATVSSHTLQVGQVLWIWGPTGGFNTYYAPITAVTGTTFSWTTSGTPATYTDNAMTISSWSAFSENSSTGTGTSGAGGSFAITSPDRFQEIQVAAPGGGSTMSGGSTLTPGSSVQ